MLALLQLAAPLGAQPAEDAPTLGERLRQRIPDALEQRVFVLEHWQWLAALALLVASFAAGWTLLLLVRKIGARRLAGRAFDIDADQLRTASTPLGYAIAAAVFAAGVQAFEIVDDSDTWLVRLMAFIVVASLIWWVYRVVDLVSFVLARRALATASRLDELLVPLMRRTVQIFAVVLGVIFLADNFGADITSLLAGVGLGGIAIALAAQDVIKNLFGSLTVLIDRPFNVGDWVQVGGVEGSVVHVGLRSTRLRTAEDALVTLPNSNLINASVTNLGERGKRRWRLKLWLAYETAPNRVQDFCDRLSETLAGDSLVLEDSVQVGVMGLGENAIELRISLFFDTRSFREELASRHRLSLRLLELADQLGVELAYPTRRFIGPIARRGDSPTVASETGARDLAEG